MKRMAFSLAMALFIMCSLIYSSSPAYAATNASVAFPSIDDSTRNTACRIIYSQLCDVALSNWRNDDVKQLLGNVYLKNGYLYYNDSEGLFYVKIVFDFADKPSTTGEVSGNSSYTFYVQLTDKEAIQLDKPKEPIQEDDWVLINSYSEIECYKTAKTYFDNQRWKDPSSITIHGYTVQYGAGTYIYYIDYSGQNSFGGKTRDTFVIEVDAATNEVIWGASSN